MPSAETGGIGERLERMLPMQKNRYIIDGKVWLRVSYAAHLLGSTTPVIKKMMSSNTLDWRHTRANSRTFVVEEEGVLKLRAKGQQWLKEASDRQEQPVRVNQTPEMSSGTMPPLRARLRNQIEMYLPAKDGGQPGDRLK